MISFLNCYIIATTQVFTFHHSHIFSPPNFNRHGLQDSEGNLFFTDRTHLHTTRMLRFNVSVGTSALVHHTLNPRLFSQLNIVKNRSPIFEQSHWNNYLQMMLSNEQQRATLFWTKTNTIDYRTPKWIEFQYIHAWIFKKKNQEQRATKREKKTL